MKPNVLQALLAMAYELQWYREHCIAILADEEYIGSCNGPSGIAQDTMIKVISVKA